ncbi:MAG: hypothetical protein LC663_03290 [Actinobacteria bacterium]|nr:hypothetical protein [Actinomycetota bacterium]
MTAVLLWIGVAALAAFVTIRVSKFLGISGPIRTVNYRGLSVPSGAGIAIVLGVLGTLALVSFVDVLHHTGRLDDARGQTFGFFFTGAAFALLGLWDDLAGSAQQRGWRAHIGSIRRGEASAGAIKLVGGSLLAFSLAAVRHESFLWTLVGALVVALSADSFNLLDVRPGRSVKAFILAMVVLILVPGPLNVAPLVAMGAAALFFLPFDLRERVMLGDTGAMALGAMVGWGIFLAGHLAELVALAVFVMMHAVADRPGLSKLIDGVPPLRALDRAGRVPE